MELAAARKWATLAIACLAALLLAIDLTVLHLAIPGLIKDLDPSATQVLWIADVYGFALAGLLVTMGNIGDRIGRKRLLLIGTAAFGVASALTAYASSAEMLIASRALLGVAGATIMPSTLSIIRNVFTDPKERTAAIGIWTGMSASGIALGPIIGGALLDNFWWGSVFLINLPVLAVILVAGIAVLPESRNPNPKRLDVPSVLLSIAGILGVVYAIQESVHHGLASPAVGIAAAVGVAGLAAFSLRQARVPEPLIDVRLFRRRAFSGCVGANMASMFALIGMSLVFAQYFQLVRHWSPLQAGLAGLPGAGAAMVGAVLAAPLVARLGRARVVALGLALTSAAQLMYVRIGVDTGYLTMVVAMLVAGLGATLTFTVTSDTLLAAVPKERAGAAAAIAETAQELGGGLGMAVLGTVLNSSYRHTVTVPDGLPVEAGRSVRDSLGAALDTAAALPADLARGVAAAANQAFVHGMHAVELTNAGLIAAVAVATLVALRGLPAVLPTDDPTDDPDPADAAARAAGQSTPSSDLTGSIAK